MHDIVIRGGTIVDGLGTPRYTGDVAIDGDRITQVGGKAGPARRDVSAEASWSRLAGWMCIRIMMAKPLGTLSSHLHPGMA